MNIAGIDYSTHAIDIVTIPHDGPEPPEWHTFPLQGDNAFDRARDIANELHGRNSLFWDEILAVGIEHPAGHHGTGHLLRIQGAILSCIPARMLVQPLAPARWRHLAGLKGSSSKDQIRAASELLLPFGVHFDTQDAHDAHLIAIATRSQISNTVST